MNFKDLLKKDFVILDGGFGTELLKKGLKITEDTSSAVFEHPQWVKEIHKSYIDAGADVILADTFGANSYKLADSKYTVKDSIEKAIDLAKAAAKGTDTLVALDVSTTGRLLEPAGDMTFEEAYEAFKEAAICGENAGADLACLETFTDLREARVALLALKENTGLPVSVTLSFSENGLTMNGSTPGAATVALCALGADAVGVNCSLGPDKLEKIVEEILEYATVPVVVKPNAGLPDLKTGEYNMNPQDFTKYMVEFYEKGVRVLGGCCGTNPQYIEKLKNSLIKAKKPIKKEPKTNVISGATKVIDLDFPRVIGERINPTGKKRFKRALEENDLDYILNEGISQVTAGAEILDVNVGHSEIDEEAMMGSVVTSLQGSIGAPLQIDSNSPKVIEKGLRYATGKCIINSVNGEEKSLSRILPLAKKYGAAIVGLTLDEKGIPKTAEERVLIAEKIINRALKEGIKKEDIIIDCLTMTVSAQQDAGEITLDALSTVKERFGVKTALGVSNVSFGLPNRETVNTAFVTMALQRGLSLPIMNPNSPSMIGAVRAYRVLKGIDVGAADYIESLSEEAKKPTEQKKISLGESIEKGLKTQAADLTREALEKEDSQKIINDILIPALDRVGIGFEKGTLFLPQLIRAADAAGACFEVIKEKMKDSNTGRQSKGKIILATVKGDVHDIGKNIVKTVLENYGYEVIDLGRNVEPQRVVDAQRENNVSLVGLSALMTTTLPYMEETVRALKNAGAKCKIMVGGAVLTPQYAEKIGADYYAKDAKMSADIAKEVLG